MKVSKGITTYPGLSSGGALPSPARANERTRKPRAASEGEGEQPGPARPPTAEEQEIAELLARGRAQWEEYQRLKASKGKK